MSTAPLTRGRLLAYAAPSLVSSVASLPLVLLVPAFYAEDLGVPLAAVGVAIAVSRLLDVVTDPLIGVMSDRFHLPTGRRKTWMVLGVPLLSLGLWKVFVPGDAPTPRYLLAWSVLLYLGFTLIDLPHKAWGAELADDYDERSRLTGWREGLSTAGQVLLLAALAVAAARGIDGSVDQLRGIAAAVVVLLPLLTALALWRVPEAPLRRYAVTPLRPWAGIALVAKIPAFVRMMVCVLLFVSGVAMQGTLHRLVLSDVMDAAPRFPLMILIENLLTLAAIPLWLRVSYRIGKPGALMGAALWMAVWSLPLIALRAGQSEALMAVVALRGSAFASILFLAHSIAADVIDVDALESGEQRSGLFFAAWGMVTKLSLALGVLLGTTIPALLGYNPALEFTPTSIQARLMLVYGALPALLMAAGSVMLYRFPIDRERHTQVRAELEARSAATGTSAIAPP